MTRFRYNNSHINVKLFLCLFVYMPFGLRTKQALTYKKTYNIIRKLYEMRYDIKYVMYTSVGPRIGTIIHKLPPYVIYIYHIDGLVQDCSNSIANALELLQSCAKASICLYVNAVSK